MNTLSSLSATPLLFQPQQTEVMVGSISPSTARGSRRCRSTARTRRWRRCSRRRRRRETIGCAKPEYCGAAPEPRRPRTPDAFQLRDVVAVDRLERRVALVVEVAAVGRPAARSAAPSAQRRKSRARFHARSVRSRWPRAARQRPPRSVQRTNRTAHSAISPGHAAKAMDL